MLYTTSNKCSRGGLTKAWWEWKPCLQWSLSLSQPKLTRKIKYWKRTRKERTHKIQISPNAVLVVHTKDVSCNPLVPDHILSVPVHMKNSTLILISIQFSFDLNLSFYRCSTTLNPEPWT
jgi:hypothetical protein